MISHAGDEAGTDVLWLDYQNEFHDRLFYGTRTDYGYTTRNEVDYTNTFALTSGGGTGGMVSNRRHEWKYDHAGNRMEQWSISTPPDDYDTNYVRNNLNQITTVGGIDGMSLYYDYAGNL